MRKGLIVASVLMGLLTAVLIGGVVLAQSDGDGKKAHLLAKGDKDGMKDEVMGRVAEILGIEQAALESAFNQALTEQAGRKAAEMLASLVEKGILTQEQADAYQAWLAARPEGDIPIFGALGSFERGFKAGGKGELGERSPDAFIDRLVEDGVMTQAQADAYKAWIEAMPDIDFSTLKPRGEWGEGKKRFGEWSERKQGFGEHTDGNWSGPLFEKGVLTEEQAEEYSAWLEAMPEGGFPVIGAIQALGPEFRGFGARGLSGLNEDTASESLAKLVENGVLTQAQADAYQAWLNDRPEGVFPLPEAFSEWGDGRYKRGEGAFGAKR